MDSTDAQQPGYCSGVSCAEPITHAVGVLSGKWAVAVIEAVHFAGGAVRFRQLQRSIRGISPKELTRQLVQLTERGVLARAEAPAAAGYVLTGSGQRLLRHMDALGRWAKEDACAPAADRPATWLDPLRPCRPGGRG